MTVRGQIGMVFQRPNPFPTMSIRDNVLAGVKLNNKRISKSDADDLVEKSAQGANLWNEVKDRLGRPGSGLSGGQRPPLHRPGHRRVTAGDPDGRAVLGAGSHLHPGHRGSHQRAQGRLHRGDRDAQHASRRPVSRTRPPSSTSPVPASRASSSSTTTRRRSSTSRPSRPRRTTSPVASDRSTAVHARRRLPGRGRRRSSGRGPTGAG